MKTFTNYSISKYNEKLSNYEWGLVDKNLKPIKESDFKKYRTLSPKDFHKLKRGSCWDYVEAQREWYEKHKIPFSTYYLELNNKEKASHTILVAEIDGKYIWDEASWKKHKGLHEFNSLKSLLKDVAKKHLSDIKDADKVEIYKYSKPPRFGMSVNEFMEWIKDQGKREN